ncbi:hypothetical protein LB507_006376 [Fusarium sp. FIESC RH6]|nr:hypothetical protein LB507_006376 [Fusarium sp. FIESC RH6]
MFKFLPVLLFAFLGSVFARGYGDPGYKSHDKSPCVEWCDEHFRHPSKSCIFPATKGKGPCYDCGPLSTDPAKKLCYDGCKDTSSDNANCGKCGISCPSETTCVEGICICSNSKQPQCQGTCPDYLSDPANCGECGKACKKDIEKCQAGSCVPICSADQTQCGSSCVDTNIDPNNCGRCGNVCNADTEKCQAGSCVLNCQDGETQCGSSCVNTDTDPNNCGGCGNVCSSGQCENGACVSPGCAGQTCDTFTACGPGGTCVCASISDGRGFCVNGDQPCVGLADCTTSDDCSSGFVCAIGSCCNRNVCIQADACTNSASQANFQKASGGTVGRRAGGK